MKLQTLKRLFPFFPIRDRYIVPVPVYQRDEEVKKDKDKSKRVSFKYKYYTMTGGMQRLKFQHNILNKGVFIKNKRKRKIKF